MKVVIVLIVLLLAALILLRNRREFFTSLANCPVQLPGTNPTPSTLCMKNTIPPSSVVPNATLPDGTVVFTCGDPASSVPKKWDYPGIVGFSGVAGSVLPIVGTYNAGAAFAVQIGKAADQLLYISGLKPNVKYLMTFNDLEIPVDSDENGIILFGKNPLPVSALPYVNIQLHIPANGVPTAGKSTLVTEVPKDKEYSVVVKGDSVDPNNKKIQGFDIIVDNTSRMDCMYNMPESNVYAVWRILSNDARKELAESKIAIRIGSANMLAQNGAIEKVEDR